ncbi:MAG: hypothetical protein ACI9F1_001833, partial [Colwellia sp.]
SLALRFVVLIISHKKVNIGTTCFMLSLNLLTF